MRNVELLPHRDCEAGYGVAQGILKTWDTLKYTYCYYLLNHFYVIISFEIYMQKMQFFYHFEIVSTKNTIRIVAECINQN